MKIILIALDTLRADHLGTYGYPMETSPFIDRLAGEGVVFDRHYSSDVPTPPAYTAMMCGQRGLHNGIFGFGHTNYDFNSITPLLAEHLSGAGYRTGMISNLLYVCPWLSRGFKDIVPPGLRFQGGTADEVTDEAATWLDNHCKKDFFLFVHYWDPHVNYFKRAPEDYKKIFQKKDYSKIAPTVDYLEKNRMINMVYREAVEHAMSSHYHPKDIIPVYDACIRYVDYGIEKLFKHLEKLGISEETLLLITSDHGEAFGEKGFFDHLSCYENIAHVPLIIRWPGKIPSARRIPGYTLEIDLMPTILDFCGLPIPEGIDGKSLKDTMLYDSETPYKEIVTNSASIPIQRMYIRDDWALVHTLDKSIYEYLNTYELFDISQDKEQETDLAEQENDRFNEMRTAYDSWLDEQLQGKPDLLQGIALRGGGWWTHGINMAFYRILIFLSGMKVLRRV